MARLADESGSGYARTPFRITDSMDRSGLDTQPQRGGGWFSSLIDATRQVVEQRRQDEQRRQEEERQRQAAQDAAEREIQQARQTEQQQTAQRRLNDPVWLWAHSAAGHDFLSSGGAQKVDYNAFEANPDKFLATNPNIREFQWGFNNDELTKRGVPPQVTEQLAQYAQTDEGKNNFQYTGAIPAPGPIHNVVKELTGNEMAAGIASTAVNAVPVVGPILGAAEAGSASGSDNVNDPRLWADAAGAVGNAVIMGKAVGGIENAASDWAVGKAGGTVAGTAAEQAATDAAPTLGQQAASLAARAGVRAGANVVENVPLSAAQEVAYGEDPQSVDFWKGLGEQAGVSAAAGAALPVAAAVSKGGFKALSVVPAELKTAAAAYVTAKQMGASDDEARTYAVMAAGGTSIAKRGLGETLRTGMGLTDLLGKAQHLAPEAPVTDLPTGPNIVYHGTAGDFQGSLRPNDFVTPNRADAEAFARGTSRLTGEPAQVIAFQAGDNALVPSATEGVAASRGAMQVADPAGLQEVGRSGVTMRPAFGLSTEEANIPPKPNDVNLVNNGQDVVPEDYAPPEIPPKPPVTNIVPPRPEDGIPVPRPDMGDTFLRQADQQLDNHAATDAYKAVVERVRGEGNDGTYIGKAREKLASLLNIPVHVVEAIDPASKYARPVLKSVLAASNFLNSQALELVGRQRQIVSDLQPLIGEDLSRKLAREAVRLAPAAAGVAISPVFGGPQESSGRKVIAAGLLASYGLHMGNAGLSEKLPFDSIKYTDALNNGVLPGAGVAAQDLPKSLQSGQGKLAHIILHPEDFNLTPEQLKAAQAAQSTLGAAFAGMQNFQKWANRDVTQDTIGQDNRLFQWFTKDSVEKVLGKDYFPGKSGKPGFAADLPVEQQRQLGNDIVDAMIKHPELRLEGDVVGLMMRDLDQKARVMSNGIIVKGLTSGTEGVDGFVKDRSTQLANDMRDAITARDALAKDSPDFAAADAKVGALASQLKAAQDAETKLGMDKSWGEIPGIDGYKFAPDVLEAVKKLAVERNGEFGGLLDRITSNIRTAMFTADLSAWTMQGWMLANRDPIGAIKAMPHVLAASILGDRYTAEWIKDNYMLSRKWAARGVVNGRMVDEAAFGTSVGHLPVVHAVESRGFSNALPLFRILMAEHMSRMEGLASMTGEGNAWGRIAGKVGLNDATRLAQFGARYGPLAAGIGVASATGGGIDPNDWKDWFALALGAGGTAAMSQVLDKAGQSAIERMPQAQRDLIETRVAKDINRVSGIQNKPQLGISQKQAQIERTFLFRSPALMRNTLIMAKLALTNPGPEGAMARLYLLQTGMMLAGASVAAKLALTGKMDSFDPNDPDSVLNPTHFAQSNLGAAGKVSASNPLVALTRAVFYHQPAEGEPGKGLSMPTAKDAGLGLLGFGENRLTDVVGQTYKPGLDKIREGISGQPVTNTSPAAAALTDLGKGDLKGVAGDVLGRMAVPIPIQGAAKAGLFEGLGVNRFGVQLIPEIKGDPNYNSTKEKILGPLAETLGFNHSPETRGQESVRRTDEAIRQQFPGITDSNGNLTIDRGDLNAEQKAQFDASQQGQELKQFGDQTRTLNDNGQQSQIDKYIAALDQANATHIDNLKKIQDAVDNKTMSKFDFRTAYQAEQDNFVKAKQQIEKDWQIQTVDHPVYDPKTGKVVQAMSVVDYLKRSEHPEDKAVDDWFALYEKATGPNGKVDFDKLDQLQSDFKANLPPDQAAYLDQRLASFKDKGITDSAGNAVSLPALTEYENVKKMAQPYWQIADTQFAVLQGRDRFFQQFKDYNDYKNQVLQAAGGDPTVAAAIEAGLAKQHKALAKFGQDVTHAQRLMRGQNLGLDTALADWYQRAPVNEVAYIANKAGDHTYDNAGLSFASGKKKLTQAQKLSLARKYGLTSPDFATTFGYR